MKLTIKNLQQQTFIVEIDDQQTVLSLKEAIQKLKGSEYEIERQKLIYAGVILDDDKKISTYNMDEKKFVVVMVKRGSSSVSSKVCSTSVEENISDVETKDTNSLEKQRLLKAEDNSQSNNGKNESKSQDIKTALDPETMTGTSMQAQAESNLLVGQEYSSTVQSIVEMGYSKELVERAMVASFNNPERAVEYLISGIPEQVPDIAANTLGIADATEVATREADREHSSVAPTISSENPFEFLRDQPQFLQMRSLIHEDPDLLHSVLQQIGQTNPALLQLIYENQEAFLNMLNQPLEGSSSVNPITSSMLPSLSNLENISSSGGNRTQVRERSQESSANIGSILSDGGDENQRTGVSIRLSVQDKEAIERLKALGFPEVLVLQAYFACEKNEQLAANFLLSSSFDD